MYITLPDLDEDSLPGEELHRLLAKMREAGPVQPALFRGIPCQIILGHEALSEAFMDDARFPGHLSYQMSIEQTVGRSFISMSAPEPHRSARRLATPAFKSKAIDAWSDHKLKPLIDELLDELQGELANGNEVDLVNGFTRRFPYQVISRMLGIPSDHERQFHRWAMALLLPEQNDPDGALRRAFTEYLTALIDERRQTPQDDIISDLLESESDGQSLGASDIHSIIGLLFPTGGETTHGALGNVLYALLRRPENWCRLGEEPSLIAHAVDEVFRWETSVAILPRVSGSGKTELGGVSINPNGLLLFGIAAANRDPSVFDAPDEFRIGRDCSRALGFGRGVKTCPGKHLAQKNLLVALEVMLQRFPDLRLSDVDGARPYGGSLRSPQKLMVRQG